jgi:hypothetical protein
MGTQPFALITLPAAGVGSLPSTGHAASPMYAARRDGAGGDVVSSPVTITIALCGTAAAADGTPSLSGVTPPAQTRSPSRGRSAACGRLRCYTRRIAAAADAPHAAAPARRFRSRGHRRRRPMRDRHQRRPGAGRRPHLRVERC